MKSIVSLCCGASLAWLATGPAAADVLCQKTNGAVAIRAACVKKEVPVNLPAVGLQGPAVRAQSPSESSNNDQVLNNGDVPEALQFDEELYDTDGMHPSGSYDVEGSKFTAPIAGLYSISAGLIWYDGNGTKRQLYLTKNATQYIVGETIPPQASGFTIQTVTGVIDLAAGDYVQAWVSHDASTNLGTGLSQAGQFGDGRNFLSMTWIGPPP
jgi:hypothetical protein